MYDGLVSPSQLNYLVSYCFSVYKADSRRRLVGYEGWCAGGHVFTMVISALASSTSRMDLCCWKCAKSRMQRGT